MKKLFSRMINKLGEEKWVKFVGDLRKAAEKDDPDQIFLSDFLKVCKKHKLELSDSERTNLLFSYPGRDEGELVRINIFTIYDQKYNIMQHKMYGKLDLHENDKKDDAIDACGYTGVFNRKKPNQKALLTEEQFMARLY